MPSLRLALRAALAALLALAWLALALALLGLRYRPNTQLPDDLPGKHVQVNGVPIRVLQTGETRSRREMLLIHGSPGSLEDFQPLIPELSKSVRVTAYDRPGQGWSGDRSSYSPAADADTALALLEALALQDVVVVGHGYGGSIALELALRAPDRISGYVLLDPLVYTPASPPALSDYALALPLLGVGGASVLGTFLAPNKIRSQLTHAYHRRPPDEDFVALRTRIWSTPKVLHASALESLGAAAALSAQSPHYIELRRPVTIVAQSEDPRYADAARRLHRDIEGSNLVLLAGVGHYLHFENMRDVADAIRHALEPQTDHAQQ